MATIRFVLEPKVDEAIPKVEQRSDSVQIKCALLATGEGKNTEKLKRFHFNSTKGSPVSQSDEH